MDLNDFDSVLFDLDGVLTPTAEVHMQAWAQLFSDFLEERGAGPYTDSDYFAFIDGKPRYDGVRSMLASRNIVLPEGDPSDPPISETVCGLGNRKNEVFNQVLSTQGVRAYPGSVSFVDYLEVLGKRLAVVSSSHNATHVLESAGIRDRFTVIVDGGVASAHGLPGKPAPDTFIFAAQELGSEIGRSIVIEDALSGVQAGRAGRFGLVIGVDRGVGAEKLRDQGADLVIDDLAELVGR